MPSSSNPVMSLLDPSTRQAGSYAPMGAVIFCRVIDNFGDAGVAWRLARRFEALGLETTLVIDNLVTLNKLAPLVNPDLKVNHIGDIQVLDWETFERDVADGNLESIGGVWPRLVLETFGCRLPDAVEKSLDDGRTRLWMNLDYLSAEDWVEGSHRVWGLHPTLPLKKLWYFPGFTDKTGGVMIEGDYIEKRNAFDRDQFLRQLGCNPENITFFVFTYPQYALETLAEGIRRLKCSCNVLLPAGEASRELAQLLADSDNDVIIAPFVPQRDFDKFLWAADGCIVRGEDSFVRAQLAALPFFWSIYPTEDRAHEVKLQAWLDRVRPVFLDAGVSPQDVDTFIELSQTWVKAIEYAKGKTERGETLSPEEQKAWSDAFAERLADFCSIFPRMMPGLRAWRDSLMKRGDLALHILQEIPLTEDEARYWNSTWESANSASSNEKVSL